MKIVTYLFLFITVTMLLVGQQLKTENKSLENVTRNLYWNSSKYELSVVNVTVNSTAINGERVKNIITKTADWAGYSMFEYGKIVLEYGYSHPQYNYELVWNILRYSVYLWVFVLIFPISIPLLALTYIIIKWIHKKVERNEIDKEET